MFLFKAIEKETGKHLTVYAVDGGRFLVGTEAGKFKYMEMGDFAPIQQGKTEDTRNICTLTKLQYESDDLDTLLYRMASGEISVGLGDMISMHLTDGTAVDLVVTDYDDDTIRLESRDCLGINTSATNLNAYLEKVYALLPEALKKRIIETDRVHLNADGEKYTDHCKLFVPAASEIFPPDECYGDEGLYQQLEWYKNVHNRVRAEHRGGDSHWYWTGSPRSGDANFFCFVYSGGSAYGTDASADGGLAPFGCIISKI